jgi:hypothetical protein
VSLAGEWRISSTSAAGHALIRSMLVHIIFG